MARAELVRRLAELDALDDEAVIDSSVPLVRVRKVEAMRPFRLRATLDDGRRVEADLEALVRGSRRFTRLADPSTFGRVEIVHDGCAVRFDHDEALEIGADLLLALAREEAEAGATVSV